MCVLLCRVGERALLAANRDEVYARPFTAPKRWVAETPFWAPRDEDEGGTWIGVNDAGLVAGIANRSRLPGRDGLRSRGHLVTGVLGRPTLAEARAWLEAELARFPRNPFQLFLARGAEACLCVGGPEGFHLQPMEPGLHVLSNLHQPDEVRFDLAPDADTDALAALLRDTSPRLPGGYAVCKHTSWRGTVASALIEPGRRFLFSDGPPDLTPYRPVT